MNPSGRRIALVTLGSFSHTNDRVLAVLRESFPETAVEVVDAARALRSPKLIDLALTVLMRNGRGAFRGRDAFMHAALRTPPFFHLVSTWARRRLRSGSYWFSLQTQSLFDASGDGRPHFVYTDHTHLENLHYPGFDRSQLAAADWVELERSIYHNATATFTMSSNVSRSLVEQYSCPAASIETVGVGFNAAGAVEQPERVGSGRNILFVGIDWERKGGPTLIAAFRAVRARHPDATLTIVGCRPQIGDVPGCRVVGRVPLQEVMGYYRQADVFCLPTEIEPFGIVCLEACSAGLPVVATRIGALPDFVRDGETGFLVKPGDAGELASRLVQLLDNPALARAIGDRGRELVRRWYNWDAVGSRMAARIRAELGAPGVAEPPGSRAC